MLKQIPDPHIEQVSAEASTLRDLSAPPEAARREAVNMVPVEKALKGKGIATTLERSRPSIEHLVWLRAEIQWGFQWGF